MFDIQESLETTGNAGVLFPPDQSMATYGGLAVGAVTLAGSSAVGTLVIPGQVLGGLVVAGGLLTAGAVKNETGAYFPFLGKKNQAPTPAPAAVPPVTDSKGNEVDPEGL